MGKDYSQGIKTNRDAWCYNFFREKLRENMKRMRDFYNAELERIQQNNILITEKTFDKYVSLDKTKINWDTKLKKSFLKGK
ncbi:type ISP restriction/modification enzyme [Bartonella sp. B17]